MANAKAPTEGEKIYTVRAIITRVPEPAKTKDGKFFGTFEVDKIEKDGSRMPIKVKCFEQNVISNVQKGMYTNGDEVVMKVTAEKYQGAMSYYLKEIQITAQAAAAELPIDEEEPVFDEGDLPPQEYVATNTPPYTPEIPDADPVDDDEGGAAPTMQTVSTFVGDGDPLAARLLYANEIKVKLDREDDKNIYLLLYIPAYAAIKVMNDWARKNKAHWGFEYQRIPGEALQGRLTIRYDDGTEVLYENVGEKSSFSAQKGEVSDAVKRVLTFKEVGTELGTSPIIAVPKTSDVVYTNRRGKTELRHQLVIKEIRYYVPTRTIEKLVIADNVTKKVVFTFESETGKVERLPDPNDASSSEPTKEPAGKKSKSA